ncbi:UNVERIFIED_CONTAM: hypothetical protein Sradi_5588200 [Sesamum radiatum]|uniref:Uncharacterized protein n=1 Tax=Sesamum radiatum TaxID=300843 RepID=A0AAW2KZV9_SESRA
MNPQIQNQEFMLKESIKHFLTSYHCGSSDFSSFESIFFRLIQTMLDPPLEITWFYSAVTFHAAKLSPQTNLPTRPLIAKDLLNLLVSCSNLSSASKKIALLAPVVYELYNIVSENRKKGLCVRKEVDKLVEDMVSYVIMSAGVYDYGDRDVESDSVVVCFEDLVRVWTADQGGGQCNFGQNLRVFFPLMTDGTWKGMNSRFRLQELVGIVLCEVFFLRLYVSFGSGMCTEDLLKDMQDQMVQIIKGFRNCHFLGQFMHPSLKLHGFCLLDDEGEYPKNVSSSSNLLSIFYRLIRDLKDPPLEIIWFYAAVTYHGAKSSALPPPMKLLVAKDLLQLLNSCSCFCSIVKKIAVIAPILYLLYHLEFNFSARDPGLREEIRIVVEGIVSYISICCSQYLEGGEQRLDNLGVYILGLVRVWTVDQIRTNRDAEVLASFFPVLTNEFQQEVTVHLGYLAGVVMNEIFFLRLYLKICMGINEEELQGDVLKLAIQTIKDMLLKLLLEPSLPVAASLSSEDAFLLHKVLYDAVMLVDYSFYSGRWKQSSDSQNSWLLATNDQARASSYLDAFCESQFVSELIQWASTQAGAADQNTRPDISTPNALIKWLLVLEDQGIRVFDQSMSQLRAKAQKCLSRVASEPLELKLLGENLNHDIFLCNKNDTNTDQEMGDPSINGFPGAFCLMNTKIDASRKRKEALSGLHESRIKQVKRDTFGGSLGEKFQPISSDNGLNCISEVKNVASDDDMELIG